MIQKIYKALVYTAVFPHNFVIGFIRGWKSVK